jgi:hypothetical protein
MKLTFSRLGVYHQERRNLMNEPWMKLAKYEQKVTIADHQKPRSSVLLAELDRLDAERKSRSTRPDVAPLAASRLRARPMNLD